MYIHLFLSILTLNMIKNILISKSKSNLDCFAIDHGLSEYEEKKIYSFYSLQNLDYSHDLNINPLMLTTTSHLAYHWKGQRKLGIMVKTLAI